MTVSPKLTDYIRIIWGDNEKYMFPQPLPDLLKIFKNTSTTCTQSPSESDAQPGLGNDHNHSPEILLFSPSWGLLTPPPPHASISPIVGNSLPPAKIRSACAALAYVGLKSTSPLPPADPRAPPPGQIPIPHASPSDTWSSKHIRSGHIPPGPRLFLSGSRVVSPQQVPHKNTQDPTPLDD